VLAFDTILNVEDLDKGNMNKKFNFDDAESSDEQNFGEEI